VKTESAIRRAFRVIADAMSPAEVWKALRDLVKTTKKEPEDISGRQRTRKVLSDAALDKLGPGGARRKRRTAARALAKTAHKSLRAKS
jgi:hypothetical protein